MNKLRLLSVAEVTKGLQCIDRSWVFEIEQLEVFLMEQEHNKSGDKYFLSSSVSMLNV